MAAQKNFYVAHIVFPDGSISGEKPAEMTYRQAEALAHWLRHSMEEGWIKNFYLGPPMEMKQRTELVFNQQGLKAELLSIMEDWHRAEG